MWCKDTTISNDYPNKSAKKSKIRIIKQINYRDLLEFLRPSRGNELQPPDHVQGSILHATAGTHPSYSSCALTLPSSAKIKETANGITMSLAASPLIVSYLGNYKSASHFLPLLVFIQMATGNIIAIIIPNAIINGSISYQLFSLTFEYLSVCYSCSC